MPPRPYVQVISAQTLICDLDSFEITYGLEDEPIAIHFGSRKEMPCWSLYKLTPHQEYFGAVAVADPVHTLRCFQWPTVPS
jgi:hypothetical protein